MTDGNVADAARLAQRNRTEFYRLLQKHALTPGNFKADSPEPDDVADEQQAHDGISGGVSGRPR